MKTFGGDIYSLSIKETVDLICFKLISKGED